MKDKTKEQLEKKLVELRKRNAELEKKEEENKRAEDELKAANQQLTASEQQLKAANQQLDASNQQLRASEQEIRGKEQEWRESFNSLEDVMLLIDKDFNIEKINDNGLKLLGKSEGDVVGRKCYEVIHGLNTPWEGCSLKKSLETGKVESVERFEKDLGGYFSIKTSPVFDEKGEIVRFVDLMRDTTERKQAEEKLRATNQLLLASEQQLKAANQQLEANNQQLRAAEQEIRESRRTLTQIIEGNSIPTFVIDREHKVTHWNKACESITGVSASKVVGTRKQGESFYSEERPVMADMLASGADEKEIARYYGDKYQKSVLIEGAYEAESFFSKMSEHGKWLFFTATPLKDRQGKVIGAIETLQDITERKQAEKALQESRDYLEKLTDSMWDAVFSVKMPERVIEWANDSFKLIGYDPKECIGKTTDFIYADKSEYLDFGNKLKSTIAAGKDVLHAEQLLKRKNGDTFPAEITTTIFREKDEIVRVTSIVRDITERKRSEESLRNSEEKFRSLVGNAPNTILIVDREGTIQFINRTVPGLSIDDVTGRNHTDFVAPEYHETVNKVIRRVFKTGKPGRYETGGVGPDGSYSWYSSQLGPIMHNGKVDAVIIVTSDITEQKNTQEALRESEERFSLFMNYLPANVFIKDKDSKTIFVNKLMDYTFGAKEWIGKTPLELFPEAAAEKMVADDKKTLEQGYQEIVETVPDRNGVEHIYQTFKFRIESKGSPPMLGGIVIDITERKRAEEEKQKIQMQLQQAQKMEAIGQLAGGIAHDFNNILGGISGYSDVLGMKMASDSDCMPYVNKIQKAALKASDLVRQLLMFARKAHVEMEHFDIHGCINQAVSMLEHTIDKRIEIITDFCIEDSMIMGDQSQIENMLLNIGVNARDAMPDGGILTFATEMVTLDKKAFADHSFKVKKGEYIKITVKDTGIGMDDDIRKKVFEPFFTTKEIGKGTGLGLASVYGSVKQHNGYITVQSEPGNGSQFKIYLPLSESAGKEEEGEDKSELIHGEGTVLVVEDEDIMREAASDMLTGLGYKVMSFTNGFKAVEYFRKNYKETDVVLLDLIMPKMNGIECYIKLKEINPQVRVVVVSGYRDEKQDIQIKELGVENFIEKPFQIKQLSKVLAEVLAK